MHDTYAEPVYTRSSRHVVPPFTPDPAVAAPLPVAPAVGALGAWGRPPDHPAQIALALALVLVATALVPGGATWLGSLLDFSGVGDLARRRRFLGLAAFVSAFLSLGYIAFYLRGGPRDPLAPAYWLAGRALRHAELSWTAVDPQASFRGAQTLAALPDRLAVAVPPGYPLVLAAGFLVGAPMLVGPLLAAGLVLVTWWLTRELALAAGTTDAQAETLARIAVGLSLVSAALHLFTADTMPFGAAAFAVASALAAALRGRRLAHRGFFALAGLAVGASAAIQPASAVAIGAIVLALAVGTWSRRTVLWTVAATMPGAVLLLAAHRAALGHAFASPMAVYAAVFGADTAPAHGRLVTLLLRLRAHLEDVDNLEPLALLALVPVLGAGRSRPAGLAALVVLGHLVVAGVLMPGVAGDASSGAFAAVLPIEHALVALGLAQLVSPSRLVRAALALYAVAAVGFGVHSARAHAARAMNDLGAPRFQPDVLREASVDNGLLYFDDDAGFELAFDPEATASHGILAARLRGDDHDRLLYDQLGHPQIHRYTNGEGPSVVSWTPTNAGSDTWRFEAESDFPPAAWRDARVSVVEAPAPCASDGHALTVDPVRGGEGSATISLPVPRGATPAEPRSWTIAPRAIQMGHAGTATLELVSATEAAPLARWTWNDTATPPVAPQCLDLPAQTVELGGLRSKVWLVVHASGGAVTFDRTTLRPK